MHVASAVVHFSCKSRGPEVTFCSGDDQEVDLRYFWPSQHLSKIRETFEKSTEDLKLQCERELKVCRGEYLNAAFTVPYRGQNTRLSRSHPAS